MTIDELYDHLQKTTPKVVYLCGKTSTGKSTLAAKLRAAAGYETVELDKVVREDVIQPLGLSDGGQVFVEVYKNRNQTDWIERFVHGAQRRILDSIAAGHPVIIDGAIANVETVQQLLSSLPHPVIAYLHPGNLEHYARNLTGRFMQASPTSNAGLPVRFWQLIDPTELTAFYASEELTPGLAAAVKTYAQSSQQESKTRLQSFRGTFPAMLVAEI